MSDDPEQQYLSDGITEDIITELCRYRELLVIARNSSFQYRGRSVDMRHIGLELGAEFLVEGSLRKAGNQLRITVQLIEAATGSHLWAERYDRELRDVFAIQDEIAQTVAGTLVGQVSRTGYERARRKPTSSWAAYDCLLQAHALSAQWGGISAIPL
jgi:adenylate cyclase